ncbi:unnamed protein product [Amaranthus hypochondriacus]
MEEEADVQMGFEQGLPERTVINGLGNQSKPVIIEELPSVPENEEKAIVLFQPTNNNPLVCSQGKFCVDANLISCFKSEPYASYLTWFCFLFISIDYCTLAVSNFVCLYQ